MEKMYTGINAMHTLHLAPGTMFPHLHS